MYVTAKKASEITGLHPNTIRKYADNGKFKIFKTESGQRRYDVASLLQQQPSCTTICYSRVSTVNQKTQLQTQQEYLKTKYPNSESIQDIGSGLNFKRKGLNSILERALSGESIQLVCTYRDRIARFGFEIIERIITRAGGKIMVLNQVETSPTKELTDDLISIITCFSSRIYGLRSNKNKKAVIEAIRSTENISETVDGELPMGV